VVLKPGATAAPEALRGHLAARFPKWWLPEKFVFATEIPRTGTGKFLKTKLRELYCSDRTYQAADCTDFSDKPSGEVSC
jgi:acyl-CoA synthetase (AMP-forming)/AMP-acid ligase II